MGVAQVKQKNKKTHKQKNMRAIINTIFIYPPWIVFSVFYSFVYSKD
jgi:hypothetical protein